MVSVPNFKIALLIAMCCMLAVAVKAQPDFTRPITIDTLRLFKDRTANKYYYLNASLVLDEKNGKPDVQLNQYYLSRRKDKTKVEFFCDFKAAFVFKNVDKREVAAVAAKVKQRFNAVIVPLHVSRTDVKLLFGKTSDPLPGNGINLKGDAEEINIGKRFLFYSAISIEDYALIYDALFNRNYGVALSFTHYAYGYCTPITGSSTITGFNTSGSGPEAIADTIARCAVESGQRNIRLQPEDSMAVCLSRNLDRIVTPQYLSGVVCLEGFEGAEDSTIYVMVELTAEGPARRKYTQQVVFSKNELQQGYKSFQFKYVVFANKPVACKVSAYYRNGGVGERKFGYDKWTNVIEATLDKSN